MSVIRVYGTLSTVIHPIVLVHLALRVIVLELKHDVRETVYGIELFRTVFPLNFVKIHVGADSPRRVRGPVRSQWGMGRERTHQEETR